MLQRAGSLPSALGGLFVLRVALGRVAWHATRQGAVRDGRGQGRQGRATGAGALIYLRDPGCGIGTLSALRQMPGLLRASWTAGDPVARKRGRGQAQMSAVHHGWRRAVTEQLPPGYIGLRRKCTGTARFRSLLRSDSSPAAQGAGPVAVPLRTSTAGPETCQPAAALERHYTRTPIRSAVRFRSSRGAWSSSSSTAHSIDSDSYEAAFAALRSLRALEPTIPCHI